MKKFTNKELVEKTKEALLDSIEVDKELSDVIALSFKMLGEEIQNLPPKNKEVINRAGMILSADGDEDLENQLNLIRNHPNRDEMIDYINGVSPCETQEYNYSVKNFLEAIGE